MTVESGRGTRPPTTSGDRLMLLLATVALGGGLIVAVTNFVGPDPDAVADVTPAASESEAPTQTARSLRQLLVEPGEPPAFEPPVVEPDPPAPSLTWIRVRADLVVREAPLPDAVSISTLEAGAVAVTGADPIGLGPRDGWRFVLGPLPLGWIQIEDETGPLVDLLETHEASGPQRTEILGGDSLFLAFGDDGAGDRWVASSTDGATWTRMPAAGGAPDLADVLRRNAVSWGAAGWLSMSAQQTDPLDQPQPTWIRTSGDGETWATLGSIHSRYLTIQPERLVGSPAGYLALFGLSGGANGWWFSPNGVSWSQMPDPGLERLGSPDIVGTPNGFYIWATENGPGAAFTPDGSTWQWIPGGPSGPATQVVPLGDGLLGMDQDPVSGAIRVWSGTIRRGLLSWADPREIPSTFGGAALALLTGDGEQAVAIAWERETEAVASWTTTDGTTWKSIPVPHGGFGEIPHAASGSRAGILVISSESVNGRRSVLLWRLDGGTWQAVRSPALTGETAPPTSCPALPTDALDFLLQDAAVATRCFGDAPMTFRAYSVPCNGCWNTTDPFTPSWLSSQAPGLHLAPFETPVAGWFPPVAIAPPAAWSAEWQGTWVEVTGHFSDPAAVDCRVPLEPWEEAVYTGRQQLIEECRRRFAVTKVAVVDGP